MNKSRFLWLLLIASLALNVFFVGGALYYRSMAGNLRGNPEARMEFLRDRLNLTEGQAEELSKVRSAMQELREGQSESRAERRGELWALMVEPELDRDALRALMLKSQDERLERRMKMAEIMHGYLSGLTPEQRAAFIEMAQDRDFFRRFMGRGDRGH